MPLYIRKVRGHTNTYRFDTMLDVYRQFQSETAPPFYSNITEWADCVSIKYDVDPETVDPKGPDDYVVDMESGEDVPDWIGDYESMMDVIHFARTRDMIRMAPSLATVPIIYDDNAGRVTFHPDGGVADYLSYHDGYFALVEEANRDENADA